ncbi:hypothetical protein BDF14DRAFT_1882510 [Spinellus fusiger]|nr:hypothetical protein BDF14DRAFT_1882510 [Spinellus fusiger]
MPRSPNVLSFSACKPNTQKGNISPITKGAAQQPLAFVCHNEPTRFSEPTKLIKPVPSTIQRLTALHTQPIKKRVIKKKTKPVQKGIHSIQQYLTPCVKVSSPLCQQVNSQHSTPTTTEEDSTCSVRYSTGLSSLWPTLLQTFGPSTTLSYSDDYAALLEQDKAWIQDTEETVLCTVRQTIPGMSLWNEMKAMFSIPSNKEEISEDYNVLLEQDRLFLHSTSQETSILQSTTVDDSLSDPCTVREETSFMSFWPSLLDAFGPPSPPPEDISLQGTGPLNTTVWMPRHSVSLSAVWATLQWELGLNTSYNSSSSSSSSAETEKEYNQQGRKRKWTGCVDPESVAMKMRHWPHTCRKEESRRFQVESL